MCRDEEVSAGERWCRRTVSRARTEERSTRGAEQDTYSIGGGINRALVKDDACRADESDRGCVDAVQTRLEPPHSTQTTPEWHHRLRVRPKDTRKQKKWHMRRRVFVSKYAQTRSGEKRYTKPIKQCTSWTYKYQYDTGSHNPDPCDQSSRYALVYCSQIRRKVE